MNIPSTYRLVEKREIKELQAQGYLLSHVRTGARVLCVECDDDNKVFSIGFRTTPESSNGVAHIIEHTVLCGSDKYPAKDPFVELIKGSLNTFLNAMTYPDKTVYPVASCNDKDFKNLMSVYMDAVFHPNIYKTRTFFEQEGWHYEMEDKDSPLIYNGVVYNEMKGAYSSADDVLQEEVKQALYPDNAYAYDSGGTPNIIPSLTYEQYIEFHKRYYHPTNSYIYLYGNCDMEERLNWIDEEYLGKYDHIEIDSTVKLQKAFDITTEVYYADIHWTNVMRAIRKNKVEFSELSKYPPVSRDLALLLDKSVEFAQVEQVARQSERKLLKRVELFDVYEGKNLPAGKKSYAVNFILQDEQKTMGDKQIDAIMQKLIANIKKQLNAELR